MSSCDIFTHNTYVYKGTLDNTKIVKKYIKQQGGHVISYNFNAGSKLYFSFYVFPYYVIKKYHNFENIFEESIFKSISFVDIYNPIQVIKHLKDKVFNMRIIYKNENNIHTLRVVSKLPEKVHELYIKKILKKNNIDYDSSSLIVEDFNNQMIFTGFYNEKEKTEENDEYNFVDLSSKSFDELNDIDKEENFKIESIDNKSDDYNFKDENLSRKKQKTK